jgi:hypothetical protein
MTIAMNVAIEVGPCEYHNQRPIRIGLVESLDGVKAAPRVQRDQEIARLASIRVIQRDTVSELAQDAGPTGRGYAVAVLHAQRRWSDHLDFHVFRLSRAGAKPRPDVIAVRGVEIPPGVANEERTCRPAAAAQHFMGAEPRL